MSLHEMKQQKSLKYLTLTAIEVNILTMECSVASKHDDILKAFNTVYLQAVIHPVPPPTSTSSYSFANVS